MNVIFQRRAIREYHAAIRRYDRISARLGDRFVSAMDVAVRRIAADPTSLAQVLGPFRQIRIKGFPYALFFSLLDVETVGVIAIAHTSRRPGYWRQRRFDTK